MTADHTGATVMIPGSAYSAIFTFPNQAVSSVTIIIDVIGLLNFMIMASSASGRPIGYSSFAPVVISSTGRPLPPLCHDLRINAQLLA